jgi:hypothetical protein
MAGLVAAIHALFDVNARKPRRHDGKGMIWDLIGTRL